MQETLNLNQAAFLYLVLFNIGEAGDEKHDQLESHIKMVLIKNGYPDDVLFDNEGEPMIQWGTWALPNEKDWDWERFLMGDEELDMEQPLKADVFERLTQLLDEPYDDIKKLIHILRYWDTPFTDHLMAS